MNQYPRRHNVLRATALASLVGLFAVGCSSSNYSGEGNEFKVKGEVTYVGRQSIGADIYEIEETSGDANGWFEDGEYHVLHDNCDCHGFWNGRKQYGEVKNIEGSDTEIAEVIVGSCVEFTGKIRSDAEGKTYDDRPVYDLAQIIHC